MTIKLKRDLPPRGDRAPDRRRQRLGAAGAEHPRGFDPGTVARPRLAARWRFRSAACASSRWAANTSPHSRLATSCCGWQAEPLRRMLRHPRGRKPVRCMGPAVRHPRGSDQGNPMIGRLRARHCRGQSSSSAWSRLLNDAASEMITAAAGRFSSLRRSVRARRSWASSRASPKRRAASSSWCQDGSPIVVSPRRGSWSAASTLSKRRPSVDRTGNGLGRRAVVAVSRPGRQGPAYGTAGCLHRRGRRTR